MKNDICLACATQFPNPDDLPAICPICLDDRQYVPVTGQAWTSSDTLRTKYRVNVLELKEGLYQLQSDPPFAIGQRALLVTAPEGNILWDCFSVLDENAVDFIRSNGGLRAIAISHPHFFCTMNEWAETFDCPVLLNEQLKPWIVNHGPRIELWPGDTRELWSGMQLLRIGGHFDGSTVLRVPFLSPGGALLCGDTFVVSPSGNHVAAMHSYPNKMPLPIAETARIARVIEPVEFDSLFAWHCDQSIEAGAKRIVMDSLKRYI